MVFFRGYNTRIVVVCVVRFGNWCTRAMSSSVRGKYLEGEVIKGNSLLMPAMGKTLLQGKFWGVLFGFLIVEGGQHRSTMKK